MTDSAPEFSLIAGYRDRDLDRLRHGLESLAGQTRSDFEFLLVDFGSTPRYATQAKALVEAFPFARHVYSEARGLLWNRAHALNTGIPLSRGRTLVFTDIDLLYPAEFLAFIGRQDLTRVFLTQDCYYLSPGFRLRDLRNRKRLKKLETGYVGLCCAAREPVVRMGGYDEFYQVWGVEDDDFYRRLRAQGLERLRVGVKHSPLYHQWHPTQAPRLPSAWYLHMVDYMNGRTDWVRNRDQGPGGPLDVDHRPALSRYRDGSYAEGRELPLNPRLTCAFNWIIKGFHELAGGETGWLRVSSPAPRRRRFPRLHKRKATDERPDREAVVDFLHLFIGIHRPQIQDYVLEANADELIWVVVKA